MIEKRPVPKGRVLVVAGSDCGGGAGIQADIKAIMAMGGYAMTAVTAITVQDTTGVHDVHPVPLDTVRHQITTCLEDIGADAVKTGMLGTAELVELTAGTLETHARDVPRIIDPVMIATSGDRLVDERAVEALCTHLLPGVSLLTPNAPEAEVLTGQTVNDVDGQRRAAEALLERGAKGVLVKGAHIPGRTITDLLMTRDGEWLLESERIVTTSTHGTGCTLASAIATLTAREMPLNAAVETARDYIHGAIRHAPGFGQGHGPVHHGWQIPDRAR